MNMQDEKISLAIVMLLALFMGAHTLSGGFLGLVAEYSYWFVRIGTQALLFFGVRYIIEHYFPKTLSTLSVAALAIILSHIPYGLTMTAMDFILGYPELGVDELESTNAPKFKAFFLELFYLLDNHIAVCLMLSLPRIMCEQFENEALSEPLTAPSNAASKNETSFLSAINPPLKGEILWVEAQEHYVQITTSEEKRMVLARFSDILRELSSQLGEQTHRSHWVANQAIVKEVKKGQSLKLLLTTGDIVPVSRSFKNQIKRK